MKYRLFFLVALFLLLVFGFQSASGDSLVSKGPKNSLACDNNGCDLGVPFGDLINERPIDNIFGDLINERPLDAPTQPAPAQPAAPAPSCNDDVRYCDANVGRTIHKTGGYYEPTHSLADARGCVYAFVQEDACGQPASQPAPAPAAAPAPQGGGQACQPGGWSAVSCSVCNAQGTGMNADGSDWGNFDGQYGSWCGCAQKFSTLQGKSFNGSNYPQCFGTQPAPAPAQPAPAQPAAAAAPAPQQPAPVQTAAVQLPQCNTLANNLVCGQKAYDSCREFTQNGIKYFDCVASQNRNCTGIIQCSVPAVQAPAAPAVVVPPAQSVQQNVQQNNTQVVNIPAGSVSPIIRVVEQTVAGGATVRNAVQECPAGTLKKVVNQQIVCEVTGNPIVVSGTGFAKELPKTGLPAVAWAISAIAPMGLSLKRFRKGFSGDLSSSANYTWQLRQFKKAN